VSQCAGTPERTSVKAIALVASAARSRTWHCSDAVTRRRAIAFHAAGFGAIPGPGPVRLLATGWHRIVARLRLVAKGVARHRLANGQKRSPSPVPWERSAAAIEPATRASPYLTTHVSTDALFAPILVCALPSLTAPRRFSANAPPSRPVTKPRGTLSAKSVELPRTSRLQTGALPLELHCALGRLALPRPSRGPIAEGNGPSRTSSQLARRPLPRAQLRLERQAHEPLLVNLQTRRAHILCPTAE
jgi:hypothetical protein